MSTIETRGIVIKEEPFKENDKKLTLLLKGIGKATVYARGAKRANSKFLAGTQLFCYSDLEVYDGRKFFSLNQIDLIESFYMLRTNFEKFCYASYFLELCDKIILPYSPCDDVMKLLLKSLKALATDTIPSVNVARVFELLFLKYNGFSPQLNCCSNCGLVKDCFFFSKEGILCKNCSINLKGTKISKSSIQAMNYILYSDKPFSFKLSEACSRELKDCIKFFIHANLEMEFTSLKDVLSE